MDRYFGELLHELGDRPRAAPRPGPRNRDGHDGRSTWPCWPCAPRPTPTASASCTARSPASCSSGSGRACPSDEVPIGHVTNGVHTRSWVSQRDGRAVRPLPRPRLVAAARASPRPGRASTRSPTTSCGAPTSGGASGWWPSPASAWSSQLEQRGASARDVERARGVLDPEALTIGFARRFATYKRAKLLFSDLERLQAHPARTPSGRCRSSSPARPTPRTTPARSSSSASSRFCQNEELRRHVRVPRGLRHERRPLPGAGRGRLAQHAAPAAWRPAAPAA